jgi:hypothetical protein
MVLIALLAPYFFRGRLGRTLQAVDRLVGRWESLRRYSYRQDLLIERSAHQALSSSAIP